MLIPYTILEECLVLGSNLFWRSTLGRMLCFNHVRMKLRRSK
jgi:hypothetical protein